MTSSHPERSSSLSERAGTSGLLSWALYDWANQAFATLIHTFVFSVYFTKSVAANVETGSAQWGTAIGLAGMVVALAAPVLGATADQGGRRKPWIVCFTLLCVVTTALMWFVEPSADFVRLALVLIVLATIGSELSLVFYNSMLPRLAPPGRLGRWSGWGWGIGYAGGLLCLIIALFVFIKPRGAWLGLTADAGEHVRATALFVAGWYLLFALPLFVFVPDLAGSGKTLEQSMRDGMHRLRQTFREVRRHGRLVRFLAAHMLYIDGLVTLFSFGGIYAAGTFGMSAEMVLVFGIALNVAAGTGAFAFAWLDDRIGSRTTILISLIGLIVPGILVLLVDSQTLFWTFGLLLGIFVGPVQAAGRSLLARMAPKELQSQMFGFFALSGKATAFAGPLAVGWITYWADSQRAGMAVIIVFFAMGFLIMLTLPANPACARRARPFDHGERR
jgi:UMF1 family MFS transporter